MSHKPQLDPVAALDRFFAVVRQEASDNSKFAARLLEALGVEVKFRGEAAAASVDPVMIALKGEDEFRATFLTFTAKDLKALAKDFNLATPADLKGRSRPAQIVDVLWKGAVAQARDRGLGR